MTQQGTSQSGGDATLRGAPDPFAGDFSQERATPAAGSWPILQWHGGLASLVGDTQGVKVDGGWFIEDERLVDLGLDPMSVQPPFERIALRLGGKQVPGWGATALTLAFIFTDFCWEDRETGKLRFPATEYERRKQEAPGTERELRGRTRALVGVAELLDLGVTEPLLLSVRGSYSAALNRILRDAKRMADEATKLRRGSGKEGVIPREAFWHLIHAGPMEDVGSGTNTSRVALPKNDVPQELTRNFLVEWLVEGTHSQPRGTFDLWGQAHGTAWQEKTMLPTGGGGGNEQGQGYDYDEPEF